MKQEFITTSGKLIVDGDVLEVKHLKEKKNFEYYRHLFWLFLGLRLIGDKGKIPVGYFIVACAGVVLLSDLVNYFYKNQWKSRFHIHKIKSVKTIPDEVGLETKVVIFFRSNTSKEIDFRTSENQHEAFVQFIEQYLTHTQFA